MGPIEKLWKDFLEEVEPGRTAEELSQMRFMFYTGAWALLSLMKSTPPTLRQYAVLIAEMKAWEREEVDARPQPEEKSVPASPHLCHWPGCPTEVPPKMWGCPRHWLMLPKNIQQAIWSAYRPGQEIDKKPSPEYVRVARAAQEWIEDNYPRST